MNMTGLGRLDSFVEDGDEDFEFYVERFKHYLKATRVSEALKLSAFVTASSGQTRREKLGGGGGGSERSLR